MPTAVVRHVTLLTQTMSQPIAELLATLVQVLLEPQVLPPPWCRSPYLVWRKLRHPPLPGVAEEWLRDSVIRLAILAIFKQLFIYLPFFRQ